MPVEIAGKKGAVTVFANDEFVKPSTTMEGLAKLKPAFKKENGTVTAGNSSGLNDGATAILIVSEAALKKYDLMPKAKIISSAVVGVEPRIMGIGPVDATKKALAKARINIKRY